MSDARGLGLVTMCGHRPHRHSGAYGGRCTACGAMWCTVLAFACELHHAPGHGRARRRSAGR